MKFNIDKTKFLIFSYSKPVIFSLLFDKVMLNPVDFHNHLGLVISSNLSWSNHINYIISKCNKKLGLLKRNCYSLNRTQRAAVFLNMIRPALEYGCCLYSNCSMSDSIRLDRLQRRAAIICLNCHPSTNTYNIMKELGWDP